MIDINMPGKDGIETIMGLKRKYPAVKIIAMGGSGIKNPRIEMAKHLGAACTLDKHFYSSEILDTINSLLNN